MSKTTSGILRLHRKGFGFLSDPEWPEHEVYVPAGLIKEHQLPAGSTVSGPVEEGKKGPALAAVETVCGLTPDQFAARTPYRRLVPIDPNRRFNLSAGGEASMRVVDLVAPIGKGARCLIASPPKAGKTMLLEQIGSAIHAAEPETRIIALLVDERPEEVTHFRRTVPAEIFASSSDQSPRQHVELAELMLAHIQIELECGRDVVVLVDSLTRMGRTFNLRQSDRGGRTLSGGLDAGALEVPRRFFGLARNIEHGGSVTIVATALIDTGSRMDQVIYEEFKATGNVEIVLDRDLSQAYIYPAISISASGTRKEHLLYSRDELQRLTLLRRALAGRSTVDAMQKLLELLRRHPTNQELLESLPNYV